jgi:hypothetical protein
VSVPDGIPDQLVAYLAERDAQRARDVDATLACLTERERRLVREAAVMGYVQGRRHPKDAAHPKDSAVLRLVIDAAIAVPDLYPVITGVQPCSECRHPKYNHREGDDPVSPGVCLQCEAEDAEEAHHDYAAAAAGEGAAS